MTEKPKILCIDDESHVVESMQLNLRKHYEVHTALSAQEGLELLLHLPNIAVVLSDMRMPEMDGATFLAMVRKIAPEAVRMLLTGYADIESAMRAVNEGQIFRFLTKPCSPPQLLTAIEAAVAQHRLVTAERVLLQNTLIGSLKALVEVLALVNPMAFGRAERIRDRVRSAVAALEIEQPWHLEFAALLSQVGAAILPEDTMRRLYDGEPLEAAEREKIVENMERIRGILENIPRLDPVTSVLEELKALTTRAEGTSGSALSTGARLLHAVLALDALEAQGWPLRQALRVLEESRGLYGGDVLEALATLAKDPGNRETLAVTVDTLQHGMVLAQDVKTDDGILILPRGFALNAGSLEHVAAFAGRLASPHVVVLTNPGQQTDG